MPTYNHGKYIRGAIQSLLNQTYLHWELIVIDDGSRTRYDPVPVHVFIDDNAASAGALISIACDSIFMTSGARIGAATVVTSDGTAAPDKYQSYMRSIMRSTAEANNRDPKIAEAMVDEKLEIPGLSKEGEVLTFSTSEAIANNYCEAEVENIEEIRNWCNNQN